MSSSEQFLEELSAVARSLQHETGTQRTLEMAVTAATSIIDGCDLAGVSIADSRGVHTRAASDDAVFAMNALQHELAEGPAVDALRHHETVYAPDLSSDERWPRWGPRIHDIGVRSVLSYRLFTTKDTLGALDLFSRTGDAFDRDGIDNALALAAHVAVAVAAELNDEHLHMAVTTRTVIGQAQGILMERFDLTADRAFQVLVRVSSHQNIKLHNVAGELVTTRNMPKA